MYILGEAGILSKVRQKSRGFLQTVKIASKYYESQYRYWLNLNVSLTSFITNPIQRLIYTHEIYV